MKKKRAFVRYTKSGDIVPGSLIVSTSGGYPDKSSLWQEITTSQCCDSLNGPCYPSLNFFWAKDQYVDSSVIDGGYYLLGINFENLTLKPGVKYTLLIDRWRYAEVKRTNITPHEQRLAGYYHEAKPEDNNRLNEIEITSTSQYFDFKQDYYFQPSGFPTVTGHGHRSLIGNKSGGLGLAFRIRVEHPTKGTFETPILNKLFMYGQYSGLEGGERISYKHT